MLKKIAPENSSWVFYESPGAESAHRGPWVQGSLNKYDNCFQQDIFCGLGSWDIFDAAMASTLFIGSS